MSKYPNLMVLRKTEEKYDSLNDQISYFSNHGLLGSFGEIIGQCLSITG